MKRSFQEVVELVVFGLIALLIGVGVLWLVGWVLGLVGLLMKFLAGLIWWLLRYIVPVAIVAGLIYFLVRVLQGDRAARASPATATPAGTGPATGSTPNTAPVAGTGATGGDAAARPETGDAGTAAPAASADDAVHEAGHGLPPEASAAEDAGAGSQDADATRGDAEAPREEPADESASDEDKQN